MPEQIINGVSLHYEIHGDGFPVVFIHGFAGTTAMWRPQIAAISKDYKLIVWDMPGHGRSESPTAPEHYSLDIVLNDLYRLLQRLGINKAVIGGLSMGGYLSLRFYLAHPEMVAALILMDTGPGYRNPARMEEWNREMERCASLLDKGIGAFASDPTTVNLESYTPSPLMLKQNPVGLAHMARRVMTLHNAEAILALGSISVPTLVVVGENDTPFLRSSEFMARAIPRAEYALIPDAGHASNRDNPGAFNRAVLGFLGGHLPARGEV